MPGESNLCEDGELVARAARGERAAFAALVERHQRAVFRVARGLTRSDDAAEDVLQETFLAALRAIGQYRGEASVLGWLCAIARNAALRRGRRADQVPYEPVALEALGADAGWGQPDVERLVAAAEDRQRLGQAMTALPEEEREVLLLRDVEGLSGEEAAHALGLSMAAMKSRLHRARLHLAVLLRGQGGFDVAGP